MTMIINTLRACLRRAALAVLRRDAAVTIVRDWTGDYDQEPAVFVVTVPAGATASDFVSRVDVDVIAAGDAAYADVLDGESFADATYGVLAVLGDVSSLMTCGNAVTYVR